MYKYHKRTKDGRGGKSDGKTYRFFDQLEALDHHQQQQQQQQPPPLSLPAPPQLLVTTPPMSLPINTATTTVQVAVPVPMPPVSNITNTTISLPNVTVPSTTSLPTPPIVTNTTPPPPMNLSYPTTFQPATTNPTTTSFPNIPTDLLSNSSSSSTSSDERLEGTRKRKRKWKDFFEKLMKEVIEKQEELHKRFLEAIEKREHDRMVREEAWRTQELQRITREREILAQERSIASAKDSAVMSFLQKIAEQQNQNLPQAFTNINIPQPVPVPPPPPQVQATPPPPPPPPPPQQQPQPVAQAVMVVPQQQQQVQQQQKELQVVTNMEIVKADNNNSGEKENTMGVSSSRWPKVEVEALIKLRTSLDSKYQENAPKGPLWEEISGAMKNLGYNRNPKRCKEKWENINKYFKKVKESNKRRPEDSKTCPYFHQLDALYREKNKHEINVGGGVKTAESMVAPLMVQPEQQWPPQQQQEGNRDQEDNDNMEEDGNGSASGSGSGSGGSSNFEVVPSKPAMGASTE